MTKHTAHTTTRIPLQAPEQWSDQTRDLLQNKTFPAPDGNAFHHYVALARNPWFFDRWLKMNGTTVMRSLLTDREKLMVIMHTAWWTRCSYAWLQRDKDSDQREAHIASLHSSPRDAGCTDAELADLARPASDGSWSDTDRALLQAVEDCGQRGGISSPTWSALRGSYDDDQLFDLVTLIGLYFLTCISLNSLGVPNYPGDPAPPWGAVDNGSPGAYRDLEAGGHR
jgi:hypothetical protein